MIEGQYSETVCSRTVSEWPENLTSVPM